MWITVINIDDTKIGQEFYNSFQEILQRDNENFFIRNLTKKEAEKWLNIVNNFLDKKGIEFDSCIYEGDEYVEDISDPYYENGVKPSDFY